jgi:hypothetical protein
MTRRFIVLAAVWTATVGAGLVVQAVPRVQAQQPRPEVTLSQTRRWMTELSNWGRWGKDDQLGTLNLITENTRRKALALAKRGLVVSLK